jgi:thiosulfate dehydrogenase [quinone] large subunit
MVVAFFESIKYVGHLLPIALLRFFVGAFYFQSFLKKFEGDFLLRPRLASQIAETLPTLQVPVWYKGFLENLFIPHWQTFAFVIVGIELCIAISYIFGYVVRPVALMAALLSLNLMILMGPGSQDLYKTFIVVHLTLCWLGAGRCLGVDYYFFKRQRGIWW